MYRYKQLLSGKVSLRKHNGQVGEFLADAKSVKQTHYPRYACSSGSELNGEGQRIRALWHRN